MNLFQKVFGTRSEHEVKRIMPLVEKTESLRPEMQKLTDEQLRDKTREFKKRLSEGETLDDLLPEAFAVVREGAKRVLGMEHYRVQIIGGIILHQGRIAEMKTGEGKTLVSTLPAYLNALEGKGVHIVTVNDYLAKRDAEWMGKVHEFLGLTVGVVLNDMKPEERRAAYGCDITYVTNNELGFDYLRDNMVIYKEQLVQRDLHYCIIDEIDSVLIDEARTPLIISGQSGKSTKLYEVCDILAQQLERGEASHEMTKMAAIMGEEIEETGDFVVNEKDKVVNLTEAGVKKVEDFFHIENLADPENLEIQHNIILALRANNLMFRDKDYVVKDDEVLIVDEFTGRIMPGRRYSDGLHQAIEAKEHVNVRRESKTLATITFQNLFNKYEKKHKFDPKGWFREFNRYHGLPKQDAVFFNMSDLICDLASKEDCIIMGRCADAILKNNHIPHISLFITAPFAIRVQHVMDVRKMNMKQAVRFLKKMDSQHRRYYNFYGGAQWGKPDNYDLCINSASYGINETENLILKLLNDQIH